MGEKIDGHRTAMYAQIDGCADNCEKASKGSSEDTRIELRMISCSMECCKAMGLNFWGFFFGAKFLIIWKRLTALACILSLDLGISPISKDIQTYQSDNLKNRTQNQNEMITDFGSVISNQNTLLVDLLFQILEDNISQYVNYGTGWAQMPSWIGTTQ